MQGHHLAAGNDYSVRRVRWSIIFVLLIFQPGISVESYRYQEVEAGGDCDAYYAYCCIGMKRAGCIPFLRRTIVLLLLSLLKREGKGVLLWDEPTFLIWSFHYNGITPRLKGKESDLRSSSCLFFDSVLDNFYVDLYPSCDTQHWTRQVYTY
jgi:hypothetical protein